MDVDRDGATGVATDMTYIRRHLLGLIPVPTSFRDLDPLIPPDSEVIENIAAICSPLWGCGDGDAASPEQCDGADLAGADCQAPGFAGGTLSCTSGCAYETSLPCDSDGDCAEAGGPCGFAAHRDWRLPNRFELESLLNLEAFAPTPSTHTAFHTTCSPQCELTGASPCSCTVPSYYWSSTTYRYHEDFAWYVDFAVGRVAAAYKSYGVYARALRGP
jgi:hypothetical protein